MGLVGGQWSRSATAGMLWCWKLGAGDWDLGLKFRCELEVGCECAGMCVDKSRGGLLRMHKEGKI